MLIGIPPFTSFRTEWWHGYMRRTIPRNALALSGNYCLAGATAISLPKSKFIVQGTGTLNYFYYFCNAKTKIQFLKFTTMQNSNLSEKDVPTWAELKEMILETSRQMRENERQRKEEQKQKEEEWRKEKIEMRREMREMNNRFFSQSGHIIEGLMEHSSIRMFQERGYDIDHCWKNYKRHNKASGYRAEYDLVLIDDTIAIVVEVKINCTRRDVDHFIEQMGHFKELSPEYAHKEILSAVAAVNYERDADKYAHEQGLFVIRVDEDEDIFSLDPSDNDTLRKW